MSDISIQHVTKRYGSGAAAVDDVSLEIADGEFVIIVGPSGSGKSTLLQMIVGLLDITEGDLYIAGERVNDEPPRDRDLAMVFQSYALYPHLTVFENIAFPLRLKKIGSDEVHRRVENVAQMLELTDFLDRKPANLSGGQRQRVAMGRAIVREAKAFLFDEPLSNLDAQLRGQVRTEIARLQKQLGATTVYVTHDQVEAMTLGDRIAVLRAGVLQQVGTPEQLYEKPVNLFVAGFIGSPPMNFMPATVYDDYLRTPFGDVQFDTARLSGAVTTGNVLIAGIRPEEIHRASGRGDQGSRSFHFTAHADVVEWLGDEQLVYVPFEAPDHIGRQLADLARELDRDMPNTQLIAKMGGGSRVAEGAEVKLAFDPHNLHLFDPAGASLTLDAAKRS